MSLYDIFNTTGLQERELLLKNYAQKYASCDLDITFINSLSISQIGQNESDSDDE